MTRVVCVGEGMLELRRDGEEWRLGYGGDVLNTAIHLARTGLNVGFLTALGTDPFSEDLKRRWQDEGLDTSLVLTHPARQAGLYAISTDAEGERSFTYWRDTSAAREMFALPEAADAETGAVGADFLYFSLLTLAILPPEGRARLLVLAAKVRARGGMVAFDSNFRPRLWSNPAEARAARDAAIACADIGLPTLEDEAALVGQTDAEAIVHHWRALGCGETVVKLGRGGCGLPDGATAPPPKRLRPVDTSGAGDAFNAGYLAARIAGLPVAEAMQVGQSLAGEVIMRPGAIPAVPEWPGLLERRP